MDYEKMSIFMLQDKGNVTYALDKVNIYNLAIKPLNYEDCYYNYKISFFIESKDESFIKSGNYSFRLNISPMSSNQNKYILTPLNDTDVEKDIQSLKSYIIPCIYSQECCEWLKTVTAKDFIPDDNGCINYDWNVICAMYTYSHCTGNYEKISEKDLSNFISQNPPYAGLNIKKSTQYKKDTGLIEHRDMGSNCFTHRISSAKRIDASTAEIVIDYYQDCFAFCKSKTVKYILKGRPSKDLKIISAETLFSNNKNIMFSGMLNLKLGNVGEISDDDGLINY